MPVIGAGWLHKEFIRAGDYGIWGLPTPASKDKGTKAAVEEHTVEPPPPPPPSYDKKLFSGVPSVYMKENEQYRWEFYGLAKNGNAWQAEFFNPSFTKEKNRGWFELKPGQSLDQDLFLKEIRGNQVIVHFEREKIDFMLEIFRISPPPPPQ